MIKCDGQISIGRLHGKGVDATNAIRIEVIDKTSGCRMVDISMGLQDFAECMTGLSLVPCAVEYNDSGLIGKTREHKKISVTIPKKFADLSRRDWTEEAYQEILGPFEIDGWKAYRDDLHNHHNYTTERTYTVLFVRYV